MRCCCLFQFYEILWYFPKWIPRTSDSRLRGSKIIGSRLHTFSASPQYPMINYFKHYHLYFLFCYSVRMHLNRTHTQRGLAHTSIIEFVCLFLFFSSSLLFLSFIYTMTTGSSRCCFSCAVYESQRVRPRNLIYRLTDQYYQFEYTFITIISMTNTNTMADANFYLVSHSI